MRIQDTDPSMRIIWEKLAPDVELPVRVSSMPVGRVLKAYLTGTPVRFRCGTLLKERGPDTSEDTPFISLLPGTLAIIPLGFRSSIPEGYEFQVRPHRETSFNSDLQIADAPATFDANFRREWSVTIRNSGTVRLDILHGQPIAIAVLAHAPVLHEAEGLVVESAAPTATNSNRQVG